ncbi:MAG: D-alanyl-D-alanine dipeptidase, partial [Mesorhizobium sp.]
MACRPSPPRGGRSDFTAALANRQRQSVAPK